MMALRLRGAHNFRRLNETRSCDGRRSSGRTLLQSDRQHGLVAADCHALAMLGLRTICDLRSDNAS